MVYNFKDYVKSYSFWLSLASALFLLIQAVGKPLGLFISEENFMSIINAVLGIFVVFGIITSPNKQSEPIEKPEDKADEMKETKTE